MKVVRFEDTVGPIEAGSIRKSGYVGRLLEIRLVSIPSLGQDVQIFETFFGGSRMLVQFQPTIGGYAVRPHEEAADESGAAIAGVYAPMVLYGGELMVSYSGFTDGSAFKLAMLIDDGN